RRNADPTCCEVREHRNALSRSRLAQRPRLLTTKETLMTYASSHNGAGRFGRDDEDLAKILAGGKMVRGKRLRRLLIARLLRDRGDDEGDTVEDIDEEGGGDEDHRLARLLVGRGARRRRLRRLLVAGLIRNRAEDDDDDEEIEDEGDD